MKVNKYVGFCFSVGLLILLLGFAASLVTVTPTIPKGSGDFHLDASSNLFRSKVPGGWIYAVQGTFIPDIAPEKS